MSSDSLSDEEFFYAHLSEYLDDELPIYAKDRFDKIIQNENFIKKSEAFRSKRGRLQYILNELRIGRKLHEGIYHLAQPKAIANNLETHKMEELGHKEIVNKAFRSCVFLAILSSLLYFSIQHFKPKPKIKFNPLTALTFESLELDQDIDNERIDFPSQSLRDIFYYFSDSKIINFKPFVLRSAKKHSWMPIGASVIDYEISQILMTKFEKDGKDFLYHFVFDYSIRKLPKGPQHNAGPILYKAFESNELNLIAWQYPNKGPMGFLVGRLHHKKLAKIAAESIFN